MTQTFCCDERRRLAVREHATLNGIDFLEVLDRELLATRPADRQRILHLHFVKPAPALELANVRITGGVRIREVRATVIRPGPATDTVEIEVEEPGDFSIYRLSLIDAHGGPLAGLDPRLAAIDFSFKVECELELDCKPTRRCPPAAAEPPNIDYLAKDYESFRRLMLDRLALLRGAQREHPADLGVTLVELLAFVGDQLSYEQDAIATEAYLGTARRRISVRRHARLVDYAMHDGANARAWVQVLVAGGTVDQTLVRAGAVDQRLRFFTRVGGISGSVTPDDVARLDAQRAAFEWFEELTATGEPAVHFDSRLQEIPFYTWGGERCTLPRGATSATLSGDLSALLQPGHVLVFEEVVGPRTGNAADADPAHRQAVRLTLVKHAQDPLGGRFLSPPSDAAVDITEIEWGDEDALTFPLCLSAIDAAGVALRRVSVARGNVVLADHGRTMAGEDLPLPPPPDPRLAPALAPAGDRCAPAAAEVPPARYRPALARGPCTQVPPYRATLAALPGAPRWASAASAARWQMKDVLPAITLLEPSTGLAWAPQRDLIGSDEFRRELVVEVDDDQRAFLRFGDDVQGVRPAPGVGLRARYRVGNGAAGNLAADSLGHVAVYDQGALDRLIPPPGWLAGARNLLPAVGGTEPETSEEVRQRAPFAFRVQERAVTPEDYAEVTERHPGVQRAVARVRWTGSWRTVFLSVDRLGGREVDAAFEDELRRHLERYRLTGHDVEITGPRYAFLELELHVCVHPDYFRSHVEAALQDVFSSGVRPDGVRGVFHPDNFTFGQDVFLAPVIAAAQAVEGVRFVELVQLHRYGAPGDALAGGRLPIGPFEIARLDSDPSFPEHGRITFDMEGGR